jgi:glycosyltransferase involved in cell wall biosynthesis
MLIAYVHRTQAKGVEGVHIGQIVRAWRRMGHEVRLVSPVGEGEMGAAGQGAGTVPPGWRRRLFGWLSKRLPELFFELAELAYNLFAIGQLAGHRSRKPDLIFERYAIFAVAGALMASVWRVPFVVEVNYTSRSTLVRKRSRLLAPLAAALDRFVFSRATGLAAVSSQLRDHLVHDFRVPPERVIVLPNAADPEVFDPATVDKAPELHMDGAKNIGFVGGFYPWHGVDILVEAFRRIAKAIPSARLVLVGDGPMRDSIAASVQVSGLADRVFLTGHVAHERLPGYINAFHVGVMPDSNDYGSPMKIFEYMALGKPVVVPDYGPLRDVVTDGREGRIFQARNVDQLTQCLEALMLDDDVHARMSENARLAVVHRHNWMENARRILQLTPQGRA